MTSNPRPAATRAWAGKALAAGIGASVLVLAGCSSSDTSGGSSPSNTAPAPTKSEIVIGNVGTYSGPSGVPNQYMPAFYEAWASWKNENGGINGHPVKFVAIDDKGDAASASAGVKDLIENQKVLALVGTAEAGLEGTWADYATEQNVPVIGGFSYTPVWNTNPNFFPSTSTLQTAVWSAPFLSKEDGKTTYGVVNCTEQSACAEALKFHEAGALAAGLKFGYGAVAPVTAPNYTSFCLAAKDAGVDALSLGLGGPAISRFATDCARQGYKPQFDFNATSVTNDLLQNPDVNGAGVPLTSFPWFLDDPATADFRAVVEKAGLDETQNGPSLAVAFVSAELFAKAAADVSDTPTADELLTGLYAMKDETLGGLTPPLTFTKGAEVRSVDCYFVSTIKDGVMEAPQGLTTNCIETK